MRETFSTFCTRKIITKTHTPRQATSHAYLALLHHIYPCIVTHRQVLDNQHSQPRSQRGHTQPTSCASIHPPPCPPSTSNFFAPALRHATGSAPRTRWTRRQPTRRHPLARRATLASRPSTAGLSRPWRLSSDPQAHPQRYDYDYYISYTVFHTLHVYIHDAAPTIDLHPNRLCIFQPHVLHSGTHNSFVGLCRSVKVELKCDGPTTHSLCDSGVSNDHQLFSFYSCDNSTYFHRPPILDLSSQQGLNVDFLRSGAEFKPSPPPERKAGSDAAPSPRSSRSARLEEFHRKTLQGEKISSFFFSSFSSR